MNVVWKLGDEAPRVISGQHKPGNPRIWTVSLVVESETHGQRFLIKSRGKLTMPDMHELVTGHMREFSKEHGKIVAVSYKAHAR